MTIENSETAANVAHVAVEQAVIAGVAEGAGEASEMNQALLDNAQARVDEAEAMAQRVTDAALQTEIGRLTAANNQRIDECAAQNASLQAEVQSLQARMEQLSEKISSLASLLVGMNLSTTAKPLLTPDPSAEPIAEALETTLPAEVSAVVESPVLVEKRNRRYFR